MDSFARRKVAVEADRLDAYRVNRYVQCIDDDANGRQALNGFEHFPGWMWRNTEVLKFIEWLRDYNMQLPEMRTKTGATSRFGGGIHSCMRSQSSCMEQFISFCQQVH